jgi:hypothetical protein
VGRVGHLVYALCLKERRCIEFNGKRGTGREGLSLVQTHKDEASSLLSTSAGAEGSLYGPYVTRALQHARMVETGADSNGAH